MIVMCAHTQSFTQTQLSALDPDFASPIPIVTQYTKTNIVLYLVPINFAIKVRGARYSTSTSKSQTDTCVHIQYGLWFRIWTQLV